jgi:hypothetical protein
MSATIIGNTTWQARGLVLTAQSAQEQITGLVNVQLAYTLPAAKRAAIDRYFVVDAPPPVWPSIVNRDDLQARNLFLVDRSLSITAGLVTIQANYAGVLIRAGTPRYYATTERESLRSFSFVSEPTTLTRVDPANPTNFNTLSGISTSLFYTYVPIVYQYQYAILAGHRPPVLPEAPLRDYYSLINFDGGRYVARPDLHWSAVEFAKWDEAYIRNEIEKQTLYSDERPDYVTPTVQLVTLRRYFL